TSDHETGGFTLGGKKINNADGSIDEDYNTIVPSFSTGGHSATLIPVFAFGPGAEEFSGVFDNTEIFHKIIKLTSWNSP
ncbi:MAG: alkaline phosphatase, partial [Bacteroidota bacterium]|nr:alkaline phosphatase [Bacteroidota bacterium]